MLRLGEQVRVAAHRRVDAARNVRDDRVVERLAHAVQALHLERPAVGLLDHSRHRVRVVGRELRIEGLRVVEQSLNSSQVGDVRRRLAGEHRIAVQPLFLGVLDLGVPIRALD